MEGSHVPPFLDNEPPPFDEDVDFGDFVSQSSSVFNVTGADVFAWDQGKSGDCFGSTEFTVAPPPWDGSSTQPPEQVNGFADFDGFQSCPTVPHEEEECSTKHNPPSVGSFTTTGKESNFDSIKTAISLQVNKDGLQKDLPQQTQTAPCLPTDSVVSNDITATHPNLTSQSNGLPDNGFIADTVSDLWSSNNKINMSLFEAARLPDAATICPSSEFPMAESQSVTEPNALCVGADEIIILKPHSSCAPTVSAAKQNATDAGVFSSEENASPQDVVDVQTSCRHDDMLSSGGTSLDTENGDNSVRNATAAKSAQMDFVSNIQDSLDNRLLARNQLEDVSIVNTFVEAKSTAEFSKLDTKPRCDGVSDACKDDKLLTSEFSDNSWSNFDDGSTNDEHAFAVTTLTTKCGTRALAEENPGQPCGNDVTSPDIGGIIAERSEQEYKNVASMERPHLGTAYYGWDGDDVERDHADDESSVSAYWREGSGGVADEDESSVSAYWREGFSSVVDDDWQESVPSHPAVLSDCAEEVAQGMVLTDGKTTHEDIKKGSDGEIINNTNSGQDKPATGVTAGNSAVNKGSVTGETLTNDINDADDNWGDFGAFEGDVVSKPVNEIGSNWGDKQDSDTGFSATTTTVGDADDWGDFDAVHADNEMPSTDVQTQERAPVEDNHQSEKSWCNFGAFNESDDESFTGGAGLNTVSGSSSNGGTTPSFQNQGWNAFSGPAESIAGQADTVVGEDTPNRDDNDWDEFGDFNSHADMSSTGNASVSIPHGTKDDTGSHIGVDDDRDKQPVVKASDRHVVFGAISSCFAVIIDEDESRNNILLFALHKYLGNKVNTSVDCFSSFLKDAEELDSSELVRFGKSYFCASMLETVGLDSNALESSASSAVMSPSLSASVDSWERVEMEPSILIPDKPTLLHQSQVKEDAPVKPEATRHPSLSSLKIDSGSGSTSETASLDLDFFTGGASTQSGGDPAPTPGAPVATDFDLSGLDFNDVVAPASQSDVVMQRSRPLSSDAAEPSSFEMNAGHVDVSCRGAKNKQSAPEISTSASHFLDELTDISFMNSNVLMFPPMLLPNQ